ncbi:MAG TPA: hypothetical protein VEG64_16945 [Candidatus Sulfotelmatobacter sp.]|nr:hypothetical protein [Candidatus Sulfotelmatobacter sp.]
MAKKTKVKNKKVATLDPTRETLTAVTRQFLFNGKLSAPIDSRKMAPTLDVIADMIQNLDARLQRVEKAVGLK